MIMKGKKMIKNIVLANIASVLIILLFLIGVTFMGEGWIQDLLLFGLIIVYCVINITLLIINETKKNEIPPIDYKMAMLSYVFNLVYPILGIIMIVTWSAQSAE
jgi:amino acid transporter